MPTCIDPQQAQRVWSRVMTTHSGTVPAQLAPQTDAAADTSQPTPPAQTTESVSPQAQLQELRRRACADRLLDMALACRLRGTPRQTMRQLARNAQHEAQTLAALLFLITGRKPEPVCVSPDAAPCTRDALRQQHTRLLARAETYQALADRLPAYAGTLQRLAAQTDSGACSILRILAGCL